MEIKKLKRSINGSFAGVCTGIAEYFDIDPTLVKLLFVFGTIFSVFPFVLTYVIMWIVLPQE